MPSPTVTIPSAHTSTANSSTPYTLYTLHLTTPTSLRPIILHKRYSDFTALHSSLSTLGATPAPLPGKSWFKSTVSNPSLTEARRAGLETYLQAIQSIPDPKWRDSDVFTSFLSSDEPNGSSPTYKSKDTGGAAAAVPQTSSAWLDLHAHLKSQLHEARTFLTRREQVTQTQAQHEAAAGAKRCLVQSGTKIARLEAGLRNLETGNGGSEKLGEGEVRRRRDLISRARKERDGLDSVLSTQAVKAAVVSALGNAVAASSTSSSPTTSTAGGKEGLFSAHAPRRVLGAPAKETNKTRELDNEGVLQLQQEIMQDQDMDVEQLGKVVRKMREMGIAINEELQEQTELLGMLDADVDRVGGKIEVAKRRIKKI